MRPAADELVILVHVDGARKLVNARFRAVKLRLQKLGHLDMTLGLGKLLLCPDFYLLAILFFNWLETLEGFLASVKGPKLIPGHVLVLLRYRLGGLGGGEAVCQLCNTSLIGPALVVTG